MLAIPPERAGKAVEALLKYCSNCKLEKGSTDMLDTPDVISILVNLATIPSDSMDPIRIPLPHDIFQEDAEVCLITKDPPKMYEEMVKAEQEGDDEVMQRVTKVMGVKTLRKEYREFEKKRKLCADYTLFICDDRVKALLPELLGKSFYKAKKFPIPTKLPRTKAGSLSRPLTKIMGGSHLVLRQGSCCMVKVGHSGMDPADIAENVLAASEQLGKVLKARAKVQSMFLKSADSVALPLFAALPTAPIQIEKAPKKGAGQKRKKPSAAARPLIAKKAIAKGRAAAAKGKLAAKGKKGKK